MTTRRAKRASRPSHRHDPLGGRPSRKAKDESWKRPSATDRDDDAVVDTASLERMMARMVVKKEHEGDSRSLELADQFLEMVLIDAPVVTNALSIEESLFVDDTPQPKEEVDDVQEDVSSLVALMSRIAAKKEHKGDDESLQQADQFLETVFVDPPAVINELSAERSLFVEDMPRDAVDELQARLSTISMAQAPEISGTHDGDEVVIESIEEPDSPGEAQPWIDILFLDFNEGHVDQMVNPIEGYGDLDQPIASIEDGYEAGDEDGLEDIMPSIENDDDEEAAESPSLPLPPSQLPTTTTTTQERPSASPPQKPKGRAVHAFILSDSEVQSETEDMITKMGKLAC